MAQAARPMTDTRLPTREELVDRARAMKPALRERLPAAREAATLPAATIQDFKDAGFFRILQPKRWGGYEMDPQVFFDVQLAIAEADMSSAWVLGVVAAHQFQIGLFDIRAQEDVWGADTSVLISSSYQPVGKVERVDGGLTLTGRWGFSSGCEHCDWVFLGAIVPPAPGESGPPDMRTFLLPRKDYQIVRDWDVFGLQATGSHGIVVDKAFVPEYRTHKASDGFHGTNPGQAVNDGTLYRLPWAQLFVRVISTGSVGAAQAALDTYYELAARRVSTNTGKSAKMDPIALNTAARAQATIDEIKALLFRNFDVMMETIRAGRQISYADRVRYRYESSQVARRCAGIADDLMLMLGGWAIYNTSPLVQWWLDLNAARAHVASDPNLIGTSLGAICLGQEVHESFV